VTINPPGPSDPWAKAVASLKCGRTNRKSAPPKKPAGQFCVGQPAQLLAAALDYQAFLKRCLGQPQLAEKILAKFRARLSRDVAEVGAALSRKDLVAVSKLAHQLTGAAGNVAAEPLYAIAVELENLAKSGDQTAAVACLNRLRFESDRLTNDAFDIVNLDGAPAEMAVSSDEACSRT
jgi:HPt (histidine-containing phosphotransfer) domain-containing protein